MPIIGSWNQTAEVSFYRNLNFSQLKWQNNFYKWIHNAQSNFFYCPEFYYVDFSRRAGDFSFKLGMLLIPGTKNGERGTGNGERGTGNASLGTSVQRQPA